MLYIIEHEREEDAVLLTQWEPMKNSIVVKVR